MSFDTSIADPKDRIQRYIDAYRFAPRDHYQGIDEDFMRNHISILDATLLPLPSSSSSSSKANNPPNPPTTCRATFHMKNHPCFSNRMGHMHGGAIAMIYDMCTTMCAAPLASRGGGGGRGRGRGSKDFWVFGGVSRTLSITFLRPVRADVELRISCEVLHVGRRLVCIRGEMRETTTEDPNGVLLSVAEHNKASIEFEKPEPEAEPGKENDEEEEEEEEEERKGKGKL